MLDFTQLRSFLEVAERGTVAAASAALGYTPPAVSQHVAKLERRLDVVLFERAGGGAVFSVGSIAWSTAMTHKGGDNDVSRITANVLDRFRDEPGPVLGEQ